MKKFIYGMSAKAIAAAVCVISFLGMAVCIAAVSVQLPSEAEARDQGYGQIIKNYSAYLLDHMEEPEELDDFLSKSNMEAAILKGKQADLDRVIAEASSADLVYGDPELISGHSYTFSSFQGAGYAYNMDSLSEVLDQEKFVYYKSSDYEEIIRYVFSTQTGLFYYNTRSGYYPVSDVKLAWKSGRIKSYKLDMESLEYRSSADESPGVDFREWRGVWLDGEYHAFYDSVGGEDDSKLHVRSIGDNFIAMFVLDTLYPVMEDVIIKDVIINPNEGYLAIGESGGTYYWVLSKVDMAHNAHDMFYEDEMWISRIYGFRDRYAGWFSAVFLLLFLVGAAFLLGTAGHRKEDDEIHTRIWDRIPFGIYTAGVAGLEALGIWGMLAAWNGPGEKTWFLLLISMAAAVLCLLLLAGYAMGVAVRVKTKHFWHYTLMYHAVSLCRSIHKVIRDNVALTGKTLLVLWSVNIAEILISLAVSGICYGMDWIVDTDVVLIATFAFFKVFESIVIIRIVIQMSRLQKGSQRIAEGDISTPIDTNGLDWEFRKHAENINQIGDGIALAVEKEMKSERFRTELITNVSHDIKTPLTSIINYVALLKKQEITDEVLLEYIDVLDRQSARLKKLTEDLMEVSKASTGNLNVELERCDADVLLTQVLGEYEERMQAENLEPIVHKEEEPVILWADGRHMWRVLDNLFGNICKYALPGTRVYIDLERQGTNAVITFRNISKYQLNISSEELLERFVRGDSSRNTEGSGLGLSIAQSLMGLMHGKLQLSIDGDLFKVILYFPLYSEEKEAAETQSGTAELPEASEKQFEAAGLPKASEEQFEVAGLSGASAKQSEAAEEPFKEMESPDALPPKRKAKIPGIRSFWARLKKAVGAIANRCKRDHSSANKFSA